MGVIRAPSTLHGSLTPICDDCGVTLCWDISEEEYSEKSDFWEEWRCRDCYPAYKSSKITKRVEDQ